MLLERYTLAFLVPTILASLDIKVSIGQPKHGAFLSSSRSSRQLLRNATTFSADYNGENIHIGTQSLSYLFTLGIGSPRKNFLMLLDTGSCDFWVPEKGCRGKNCKYKKKYNVLGSETGEGPLDDFHIKYLDSQISGYLFKDRVYLGSLKANIQSFGAVDHIEGQSLVGDDYDGVFGLCPARGDHSTNLITNLVEQGQISRAVFSLWLSAFPEDGGILTVGEIKRGRSVEELVWFKSVNPRKWATKLTKFKFGASSISIAKATGVALDSGSTLISIPTRIAKVINQAISGLYSPHDRLYEVDCEDIGDLPDITFYFGEHQFVLTPDEYISIHDFGCFSNIEGRDIRRGGHEVWILGAPFLRAYFTAYDIDRRMFGIAKATQSFKKIPKCSIHKYMV